MKKLAIVGGGVTRSRAPFSDESYDIWSTASVGLGLERCTTIFELHRGVFTPEQLNAKPCKKYLLEKDEAVENSEKFPIDSLVYVYGKRFNGTVVMMLAFAALEGYKHIELYGIDFSSDEEYARRNMFFWMMGHLSALGYKIEICPGGYMSDECPSYMYEDDGKAYLSDMIGRAAEQLTAAESSLQEAEKSKIYLRGVMDTLKRIERR